MKLLDRPTTNTDLRSPVAVETRPEEAPVTTRPPVVEPPRPTRFVRWLGWLTALVIVVGGGFLIWNLMPASSGVDATEGITSERMDIIRRATSGYDAPAVIEPTSMWGEVLSYTGPEAVWQTTAAQLGYTVSGMWITADGVTWEHLDGTIVVGSAFDVAPMSMWEEVLSYTGPEAVWQTTAAQLGYTVSGMWITADGVTWEHLDGTVRTITSQTPS